MKISIDHATVAELWRDNLDYITTSAGVAAHRIADALRLPDEEPDFRQDLLNAVALALPRFDASRSNARTFVSRVIRKSQVTVARRAVLRVRRFRRFDEGAD